MCSLIGFCFFVLCLNLNLTLLTSSSILHNSSSSHLCHEYESSALLRFLKPFTIIHDSPFYFYNYDPSSWKEGTDCCEWDGITCHPITHHVIGLHLSSSGINGTIEPNSTLFLLRRLQSLDLAWNSLTGEIPVELSQLSQLKYLDLSRNLGLEMPTFKLIIDNLTSLEYLRLSSVNLSTSLPSSPGQQHLSVLDLGNCSIHGNIPTWVWNISKAITLSNNNLAGNIPYPTNTSTLLNLDMSFNNLNGNVSLNILLSKLPPLETLWLSSSGLSVTIVDAHVNLTSTWPEALSWLGLSNCSIHGEFPKWIQQVWKDSLEYLDLSHNSLTGSLANFFGTAMYYIDISNNMLTGPLPNPSNTVAWFRASNNKFTGSIPSSFCNLIDLTIVDFSNNNLSGDFPHCLGNVRNSLVVLNLRSNKIHGTLPKIFVNCSNWEFLDLSGNRLQGSVPQSLAYCTKLHVLNLKSNNFRDQFPYWLGTLPSLQVLDLSSNNFYGNITHSKLDNLFPLLQIIDLSNNKFSGKIPTNFKAMINIDEYKGSLQYLHPSNLSRGYLYSINLTFNGVERKYEKIISSLFTIDLSSNGFEGEIPNNIGDLVSIRGLNLSHNRLMGSIPPSIGKLTLLDCLDLSHNELTGRIPQELASLTSLGVFNVSENQLVGPIPHGNNFNTFQEDSYRENLGLCGFPLPQCGEDGRPRIKLPTRGSEDDYSEDEGILSEWKIIMMGYACGTVVGLAWGYYMVSVAKPFLLVKCVTMIELAVVKLVDKRRTKRG